MNWEYYVKGKKVVMSYDSPDNEEGFPGNVLVNVSFELTALNEFKIEFTATSTKPTFVNLTNHSYFNLAGHNKGAQELYKHVVSINADNITETDQNSIPTGRLLAFLCSFSHSINYLWVWYCLKKTNSVHYSFSCLRLSFFNTATAL